VDKGLFWTGGRGADDVTHFGKYEVLSDLGQGGSGHLYRAYDAMVGRQVAIKVLSVSSDQGLKRFRQEATAVGNLQHPNIVSIFDFGDEGGRPFLVMELLEGRDLSRRMASGGTMPLLEAVETMQQVALGLHHAHTHGVVHRDVAPRNIWLTPDARVKIIDFGIASHRHGNDTTLRPDDPLGTVLYFSPEHLPDSRTKLDARSDIFSFGTVFYELISGHHPFAGGNDLETICNIQMGELDPVSNFLPGCPPRLAQLIRRALSKELELRYQDLQELLDDLNPILLELRRREADTLVGAAKDDLARGCRDEAKNGLARALKLSPDHEEARDLNRTIRLQQLHVALESKISTLLNDAGQKLRDRKFAGAVGLLNRANKLDPENGTVSRRLDEAMTALANHEESLVLVRDGEGHLKMQRLEAALASAQRATQLDSGSPEACRLLESIREASETHRKRRLPDELSQAKKLLADEHFSAAVILLETIAGEFPEDTEAARLLSYGREEIRSRRRARIIDNVAAQARRRAAFGDFEAAKETVTQALKEYPEDSTLAHLLNAIKTAKANKEQYRSQLQRANPDEGGAHCACGNILPEGMRFCDRCGRAVRV